MENRQLVIIITSGKSGSYLFMSLLDWHPEVVVFPQEENLVDQWLSIQKKVLYGDASGVNVKNMPFQKLNYEDVLEYYMQNRLLFLDASNHKSRERTTGDGIDFSNIDYSIFVSRLNDAAAEKKEIRITEWSELLFEAYTNAVQKYRNSSPSYFVLKTVMPGSFTRYADIFPDARFVHLVRHPYDVFNAYKRNTVINKKLNYYRPDFDLLEYIIEEKLTPVLANAVSVSNLTDQHYIIRYEDMVSNTREETMKLCRWLGVSWNDNMTIPTIAGEPFMAYSDNQTVRHNGLINTKRISVFKETLSNREIRLIDYLFHDKMECLGYDAKYGKSGVSLLWLSLGLILPLKLELKNWNAYTIIGMFSRRFYILHRIIDKFIQNLVAKLNSIKSVLKKAVNN